VHGQAVHRTELVLRRPPDVERIRHNGRYPQVGAINPRRTRLRNLDCMTQMSDG
jgi:hypothetical protein